jgi:hypothetical protein
MKAIIIIIIIIAVAAGWFFLRAEDDDLMEDPDIKKFAIVNSELAIEFERVNQDSILFEAIEDSIYMFFGIDEAWMGAMTDRINEQPERWEDIYGLMIEHTEMIRDSLLHKRLPASDSSQSDSLSE